MENWHPRNRYLSLTTAKERLRNGAATVRERLLLCVPWPLSIVRGCSENTDADFAALVHGITASTEPRMETAAIRRAHRSLVSAALFVRGSVLGNEWSIFIIGGERSAGDGEIGAGEWAHDFHPLGVNGLPVMERSVLRTGACHQQLTMI